MMEWGSPNLQLIKQQVTKSRIEKQLSESQIHLNRKMASSFELGVSGGNKTVVNNHFNIIINVSPDVSDVKIASIVQKLTTIVDRVN